ncbi:cobalamin-binding protein [Psychrobium sp. 1_MG-2023]|uniref:cobalamin-binding protein n=1 Tax=Psychrobium sp. 1_MG-2023 TaxID=3062624 RepID=UPI00268E96CA|nr:cobalamin-binding protein [Psychrobium sp. 1_MG-2023]MDP2559708.1 cobalamin-binding protein [Psychrobium sp. 1_MG-2023]
MITKLTRLTLASCILLTSITAVADQTAPKRIIALSPHSVELLYSLGVGDRIVGTISHADYPEQAKSIEVIGDYKGITLEKVIALKPDLIVTWSGGNKINQIEQIKQLGFTVVDSNPQSLTEIASNIRHLGNATGQVEQANKIAAGFERELAEITAKYQKKAPIKTFYQLWSKPLMTISEQSWISQYISRCGGINVFADTKTAYPKVSVENVLLSGAEVILVPRDKQTRDHELFNWEQWQLLPAVKNNHIYYPNATILHRPTPRVIEPMREVCEQINRAR